MELRHLRYFVAVAEHLHFGRAAEELVTAQPSLSRQIAQLEDELGVMLFERTNRHVALTDAGRLFLADARRTLESADASMRHARENAAGTRGELRVGFLPGAMLVRLPDVLRAHRERFPDVEIVPTALPLSEHVPALRAGTIDVAWTLPTAEPDMFSHTMAKTYLLAALPDDHRLAKRKRVAVSDFTAEHLIVLAREMGPLYDMTLRLCLAAGYRPPYVHELHAEMAVLGLVAAGFGIALAPRQWSGIHMPGVSFRPLDATITVDEVLMGYRNHDRPLARAFIATALEVMAGEDKGV